MLAQGLAGPQGDEEEAVGTAVMGGIPLTGGRGNLLGTLTGVMLLGIVANELNLLHVNASFQHVVNGLIIIAVIVHERRQKKR
jgi:ribose transport system permease protein